MQLIPEEQAILDGEQGQTLQKVMRSVVAYGEAFGAERLVAIEGSPHLVGSFGLNTLGPYYRVLDELIKAKLKTQAPFTVNPRPLEFETLDPGPLKRLVFGWMYGRQKRYEAQLHKLGLRDTDAFSCACYLPEAGNRPRRGAYLAWSESSAVVFANSVLGARTNRNSAGIDLMCDILGKAPLFGLMTPQGRRAAWRVEVATRELPNPQLLGSAIGLKVMEDVPYIFGLERFLGRGLNPRSEAFLKDMGAASASNGAVGLYHVAGITPEAVEQRLALLRPDARTYRVDETELERVRQSYPVLWKNPRSRPLRAFIGCPHLSMEQLSEWEERIRLGLQQARQAQVSVPTILFAGPQVRAAFQEKRPVAFQRLREQNVRISAICPLMYMANPLCAREPVATSSNKLRTFSSARFFLAEDLLQLILSGRPAEGGAYG